MAVQEGRLQKAMGDLREAQAQLDAKQQELDQVQALYDAAMREKQALLDDAESCRRKMQAASALINGLGGEKERWTAQSKEFQSQIGRYICTCSMLVYATLTYINIGQAHLVHYYCFGHTLSRLLSLNN